MMRRILITTMFLLTSFMLFPVRADAAPATDESAMVSAIIQCAQAETMPLSVADHPCVKTLIQIVFPDDADWAIRIATRESGLLCKPKDNGTGSGLFQLFGHEAWARSVGVDPTLLGFDCMANLRMARVVYDTCGHAPWNPPLFGCAPIRR